MKNWIQRSMLAGILLLAANLFFLNKATAQYTWIGANNASWATSTNWSPTRITPAAGDVLLFNSGTTLNVTAIPTQTVGRIVLSNNTNITLQATTGGVTLTIGNGTGVDLDVPSGSTLVIGGSNGLTVTLANSATASIAGTLTVNSGRTYNTNGTTVVTTVAGTLNNAGTVTSTTASKLVFSNGSTYNYQENAGGAIPTSTWGVSSNCNITGVTGTVPATASFAQAFGNFTWNCASQTADLSLVGNLTDVNGNFTVTNTNTGSLRLSNSGVTATINIDGNFSQTGGEFFIGGTGGSNTWTVNIGGSFSLTGGSLDMAGGGGATTINVDGDFTATAGTLTESAGATNTINFSGTGTQTYTSGATISNSVNFNVNSGATLQMAAAATVVQGGGTFTIVSGGTLGVTSTAGITTTGATGNIQVTGTRTYNDGANYIYNGSAGQVAGNGLTQNDPGNITINNATSVTLSANTILTGNILISQGTFSANNFDITISGNWTNNGTAFTGGTGDATFTGSTQAIGGTASSTFGNLIIDNGAAVTMNNSNTATTLAFVVTNANTSLTLGVSNPTLTVNGTVAIAQATSNSITTAWNINAGTATVSGLISYNGTNTTTSRVQEIVLTSGTLNANGGITFANANNTGRRIVASGAANINLKGALTTNGQQTLTAGTTSTFNYNDNTTAQTVDFFSAGAYNNLNINTTGGAGATLSAAVTATNVTGNLNVQTGTLNNGGFAMTLANNKSFNVANAATFNLTGTSTMPTVSGTGTRTVGATSTVNYAGAAQAVPVIAYGILELSGSGNKTFAGSTTIAGNFDISGTAVALLPNGSTSSAPTLSFNGVGQVNGSWGGTTSTATNKSAARLGATTTGIINITTTSCNAGEWTGGVSTDWFTAGNWCSGIPTSSTDVVILAGAANQPNINAAGAVCRNITINSGATVTITGANGLSVSGDWTNNGTFTGATSTVTFTGAAAQIIAGSTATAFGNLTINKTAPANTVTSNTTAFTVAVNLAVTQGNLILTATDANYTVTGNLTVSANGTLAHNVDWDVAGKQLNVGGNIDINGAYTHSVARSHVQMTGTSKTLNTGTSSLSIVTLAGATVTANGPVTITDNFWAPFGTSGSFSTGGQTVIATGAVLISAGTVNVNGGSLTVSGGVSLGSGTTSGTLNVSSGTFVTDGITLGSTTSATASTITQSGGTFTVNGPVTINQPTVGFTNGWNINAQTATVSGLITFAGTFTNTNRVGSIVLTTGTLNANGGITFAGTIVQTKLINLGTTGTVNMKGALTGASAATLTSGTSGSIFNYNDNTTAQTVNFFGAGSYHNLHINTTGGVGATLAAAISATNVTGNLRVQSGTLNNGGFAIVGNAARTLEVANGAFLQLAGTTSAFPTVFGTISLGATSTVDYRGSGAQTIAAQNYGNLTTTVNGTRTITLANSGTIGIAGVFTPAVTNTSYTNTGSAVSFNGTTGGQNIPAFTFNNLVINNTADVTLTGNVNVNGTTNGLTFTNGKINTGANTITLAATTTVTTAGAGKYVNGKLAWNIPAGTPTRTFFVGDATNFTPATIAFTTSVTTIGIVTVSSTAGDNSSINTSAINPNKSINRFWTIANTTVAPVGYDATFTFINPGDLDAGVNTANVEVQRLLSGTWNNTTIGTRTSTTTNITGVNGFGDFQIGEKCTPPVINTPIVTNVSCNGSSDGAIDISTTGGSTPFTYLWSNGAVTEDLTAVPAGTYTLTITATGGCTVSSGNITVTEPAVLNASVGSANADCNGSNTGSINITLPTGGYGTYEYSVDGGGNWQSSGSFAVGAGTYDVRIRDAAHTNCEVTLNAALLITEPAVLNANNIGTDASCGNNDGQINITSPTGGSGTYDYTINGGTNWQASGSFTGLAPGSYDVRIRDAAHPTCVVILDANQIINQASVPDAPTSGGNQTVCFNGDPEQTITATATSPVTIIWYDAASGGNIVDPPSLTGVGAVTYYAEASSGACVSTTRTAVTLTIQDAPAAPVSGGDETVCSNGSPTQTLIATATSPVTITWFDAATAGNIVDPPALIGIGTVTYYAEASNGTCTSASRTPVTLTINPVLATPGAISGPLDVCPLVGSPTPSVYSIAPVSGATFYTWHVPPGTTIVSGQGTTDLSVTFDNSYALTNQFFTVTAESPSACTSAASSLEVLKNLPGIPTIINGPTDACPFIGQPTNAVYSIDPVLYATSYTWTVAGAATIVSGQGSLSIEVSYLNGFTTGNVKVTANSNCGNRAPRSLNITKLVPASPLAINGPTDACPFIGTATQVNYTIDPVLNATSYTWTVPGNVTLVSGQGSTSIMVTFNSGYTTGIIKVRSVSNCASSGDRSLNVGAAAASQPAPISGPTNSCPFIGSPNNATYSIPPVANATSYNWTVPTGASIVSHPAGTGINDTIITVSFNNSFVTGTSISVTAIACIPSTARTLVILRTQVATPGLMTGATNVCPFMVSGTNPTGTPVQYTVRKVANATSYNWSAPSGSSITAHPGGAGVNDTIVEITYSAGFVNGNVSVAAVNDCGAGGARTLAISRLTPSTPSAITPVSIASCPSRQYTYTITGMPTNATSVLWTVPATGTIQSGQGTTSITVSYTTAAISGNVTATGYNNCGNGSTRSLNVSAAACPGGRPAGKTIAPVSAPPVSESLKVNVFPNPTVSDFKLQVITAGKEIINVRILDMQGRELSKLTVMPSQTINIGSNLKSGSYMVEVVQGKNRMIQKLMKF